MSDDIELPDGPLHFVSANQLAEQRRSDVAQVRVLIDSVASMPFGVSVEGGPTR